MSRISFRVVEVYWSIFHINAIYYRTYCGGIHWNMCTSIMLSVTAYRHFAPRSASFDYWFWTDILSMQLHVPFIYVQLNYLQTRFAIIGEY